MEVAYTITLDDYVAFSVHMNRKSKVARGSFLFSWLLFPLVCLFSAVGVATTEEYLAAPVFAAIGVLWAVVYPPFHRMWVARYVRAFAKKLGTRGITGPIRLVLSDDSLVEITESPRSETKWQNMAGIEETSDYTFILITGISAVIVPRHGFEQEEDYFKVRDFVRARIGQHGLPENK